MQACRISPPELVRALAHVVKATSDDEAALVQLTFANGRLTVQADDARGRVAWTIDAPAADGAEPIRGTYELSAALLRNACRRGEDGLLREDALLALTNGGRPVLSLHARSLTSTTDERQIVASRTTAPVPPALGPYRVIVKAEPRQWAYLAEFAGDDGMVHIDSARSIAYAVRLDGSVAAVALSERRSHAGFGEDSLKRDAVRIEKHALPPIDAYRGRQNHPDLQYMQKDLFGGAESPFLAAHQRDAIERRAKRAAELMRTRDHERLTRDTPDPVTIRGSTARAIAFAVQAQDAESAARVRAETRALRRAGENISPREAEQRLRDVMPEVVLSPVGEDVAATVGPLALHAPVPGRAAHVDALIEPVRKDLGKRRDYPEVEVDAARLRELIDWTLEGERRAVLADPNAEAYVAVSTKADGTATLTAVRPGNADEVSELVRQMDLGPRQLPRTAAPVRLLARTLLAGPDVARAKLGVDEGGRIHYRHTGLEILLSPPRGAAIEAFARRRTVGLAVSAASLEADWIYAAESGGRDAEITEIMAEEMERGRDARSRIVNGASLRGPLRNTRFSEVLAERFGRDARRLGRVPIQGEDLARLIEDARRATDPVVRENARARIVAAHSRFFYQLALERPHAVPFADRLSLALEAAAYAINTGWQPDGGASFIGYVRAVFRSRLSDALAREGGYQISFTTSRTAGLAWVMAARRELLDERGEEPTAADIAERLGRAMSAEEIRSLPEQAMRDAAIAEREKAIRWVEERLAIDASARALSIDARSASLARRTSLVERIRAEAPDLPPAEGVSAALGRVLDRMSAYESELLRSEAGLNRFELTPAEWRLYAGVTPETALVHLDAARQKLAAAAPDRFRRSGR